MKKIFLYLFLTLCILATEIEVTMGYNEGTYASKRNYKIGTVPLKKKQKFGNCEYKKQNFIVYYDENDYKKQFDNAFVKNEKECAGSSLGKYILKTGNVAIYDIANKNFISDLSYEISEDTNINENKKKILFRQSGNIKYKNNILFSSSSLLSDDRNFEAYPHYKEYINYKDYAKENPRTLIKYSYEEKRTTKEIYLYHNFINPDLNINVIFLSE